MQRQENLCPLTYLSPYPGRRTSFRAGRKRRARPGEKRKKLKPLSSQPPLPAIPILGDRLQAQAGRRSLSPRESIMLFSKTNGNAYCDVVGRLGREGVNV